MEENSDPNIVQGLHVLLGALADDFQERSQSPEEENAIQYNYYGMKYMFKCMNLI